MSAAYRREDVLSASSRNDGSTPSEPGRRLPRFAPPPGELGHTAAQVALAWTLGKPGVTSTLLGARTPAQLEDNLGALALELTDAQVARLDAAGAITLGQPHDLLAGEPIRQVTTGGLRIEARR
ncbi:aldo/keto reductase [Streptomyces sp. NRRL WC-3742]|uniref:aldo/keto reductase n=1 Tax=Streptomyces sp. NRRL WC-3742 TaxID=1463934 RepID=UPI00099B879C|nr:aldo/keto reductase [Streptomyces sp. NRRL WC-3742]